MAKIHFRNPIQAALILYDFIFFFQIKAPFSFSFFKWSNFLASSQFATVFSPNSDILTNPFSSDPFSLDSQILHLESLVNHEKQKLKKLLRKNSSHRSKQIKSLHHKYNDNYNHIHSHKRRSINTPSKNHNKMTSVAVQCDVQKLPDDIVIKPSFCNPPDHALHEFKSISRALAEFSHYNTDPNMSSLSPQTNNTPPPLHILILSHLILIIIISVLIIIIKVQKLHYLQN